MTTAGVRIAVLAQCLLEAACASGGPRPGDGVPGDVRTHGAVCDGRADDTQALIRAGQSAQEVFIAPGLTCRVTGPLASGLRTGQRWYGGGMIATDDGFNFTVFSVTGKTDVTFDGLAARSGTLGASYSAADARFIEFISGAHRGRAVNNRIGGFQQAIRVHGSTESVVDHNEVTGAYGWGISIQTGAHQTQITRNRESNGDHGILVHDDATTSSGNRITHNTVRGNRGHGTVVSSAGSGSVVRTCVVDNEIEGNGGEGGRGGNGVVVSGPATTRGTIIDGNRIRRQRIGINVAGGSDTAVGRSSCDDCETSVVGAFPRP